MEDDHHQTSPVQSKTKKALDNVSSFLQMASIPFKLMRPSSGPAGREEKLAWKFSDRYREQGNIDDLEAAIKHQQASLDATPAWHPYLLDRLSNLAASHSDRYQRLGDLSDLETAIKYQQVAIEKLPAQHPDMPTHLRNLAISLVDRYRRQGGVEDLEKAIVYEQSALNATPEGDKALPGRKQSIAVSYMDRYQRLGDLRDVETAIKYSIEALDETLPEDPELPTRHLSLGMGYSHRYRRLGNIEDLKDAVKHKQIAVDSTPPNDASLPVRQHSLAITYTDLYRRQGDLANLTSSLRYTQAALEGTPEEHPDIPVRQQSLALVHMSQYNVTGDMKDLETAIKYGTVAIDNTPPDHPLIPDRQQSLANAYRTRYERLRDIQDLNTALQYNLAAVEKMPEGHPDLAGYQRELSSSYTDRYNRLGDVNDLKFALKYDRSAVSGTPSDHPDYPSRLHNLAMSYKAVYQRTRDMKYLETSLVHAIKALECTPPKHASIAGRQQSLAGIYRDRYLKLKDVDDLEAALKFNIFAVNETVANIPELPIYHQSLAISYELKYEASQDPQELESALHFSSLSSKSISAPPLTLWNASISWAEMAWKHGKSQSVEAYASAFNILPDLIWIGSSINTRHDIIVRNQLSTVTSTAVATALYFSDIEKAVEFFEQGLSITHRQALQLKDPATVLWDKYPEEAQKLQMLSLKLADSSGGLANSKYEDSINYNLLAAERTELLEQIRKNVGFEDFLRAASYPKLCKVSQEGPVIMLNCDKTRCDAIIVLSPDLPAKHVQLLISLEETQKQLEILQSALRGSNIHTRNAVKDGDPDRGGRPANMARPQDLFQGLVLWLWKKVVQPVFIVLHENNITSGRLWWCPSGPFTYLPIHAAAPLSSKFIQSYTYTLDALIQSREKTSANNLDIAAAVAVTEIPDQTTWLKLPSVKKELEAIALALNGHHLYKLVDSGATIENVIKQIESSSWLHLACHGQQDINDPLNSALMLYDGRLELKRILDTNLPSAKFVFLSACETAMGDAKLVNEAMHMAGGFIAAGFQGAIGTLWSMADADGPKVADTVYRAIFKEHESPDVKHAGEGLHIAVQKLRQQGAPFHQWIPFIHVGV